jgi:hypothetical protein
MQRSKYISIPKNAEASVTNDPFLEKKSMQPIAHFTDNRPETAMQLKLQESANKSRQVSQLADYKNMADNSTGNSQEVVQQKIHYNKTSGFFSDEARPAWRKALKDHVIEEYNDKHGTAYTSGSIDLNKLHLDRCHIVSFKDIQNWLLKYLNGTMTQAKFAANTDKLYATNAKEKADMESVRTALFAAKKPADKLANARGLLSYLNSAIGNVALGNDSINRSIQDQLDLNFKKKGSSYSATPNSKRTLKGLSKSDTSGIPKTPTGNHIKSSRAGVSIPMGSLTPGTDALVTKHDS